MSSDHSIQCSLYQKEDQQMGGLIKHMCEKYEIRDILAAPAVPHGSALALDILRARYMAAWCSHM
jgi:hypothetical protein